MGPTACLGALHHKSLLLILGNEPRFLGGPPSLVTTQPYENYISALITKYDWPM